MQPKQNIVIFCGTFDPPHMGHQIIVDEVVRKLQASKIIIIPNPDNNWKPDASPRYHRIEMLKLAFADTQSAVIWDASKEDAFHEFYRSDINLSFLIGADCWDHYKDKDTTNYNQIVICSRKGYSIPNISEHQQKPVRILNIDYPEYSSTKIREYFHDHPIGIDISQIKRLHLNPQVGEYILKHHLYTPDRSTFIETFTSEIINFVKHRASATASATASVTTPITVKLIKGGLSGNLVVRISTPEPRFFVKVMIASPLSNEIMSNRLYNSLELKKSRTPTLEWVSSMAGVYHVGYAWVPGYDFGICLQNNMYVGAVAYKIGSALRELHSVKSQPIDPDVFKKWYQRLYNKVYPNEADHQNRYGQFASVINKDLCNGEQPYSEFISAINAYINNPGSWTYVHGDANPGNFMIIPPERIPSEQDTIVSVDIGTMYTYLGELETPQGYPGYEYYQFLSSLRWYQQRYPVSDDTITQAEFGFCKGYGDTNDITPEAHRFYSLYWKLRSSPSQAKL